MPCTFHGAVGIGRSAPEEVFSGRGLPLVLPASPGNHSERVIEARILPRAVDTDFDAGHQRRSAPGPSNERDPSGVHGAPASQPDPPKAMGFTFHDPGMEGAGCMVIEPNRRGGSTLTMNVDIPSMSIPLDPALVRQSARRIKELIESER